MNIIIGKSGDVKILPVFKGQKEVEFGQKLYDFLIEKELFKGNNGEVYPILSEDGKHTVLLGLGEEKEVKAEGLRKAFFKLARELMRLKVETAFVSIPVINDLCYGETIEAVTEGLLQSEYSFEKYLSEKKILPTIKEFNIEVVDSKEDLAKDSIEKATALVEGIFLARDLVNERAIVMTPEKLANTAKEELEPLGVKVDILGQKEIEDLGMEAFLAVSKGSANEPKFIKMTWDKGGDSEKIALVGKGLTYDSGGYSLKPSTSMDTMYSDMAGSASVIGTMKAIAKNKLEKNVVAIVAACENLISGEAYKPGDIIGSMAGKTIEVLNTDAEGRLTLADALYYAATVEKADKIIDIATLTGACIVALGNTTSGAITNNKDLMEDVIKASDLAGEYVWQLPSHDEYRELIKGSFADLSNTGGRGAGTITAGLFLENFVNEVPWVHLDIAGTSYISKEEGYLPKGATGIPVKTLYNLVKIS